MSTITSQAQEVFNLLALVESHVRSHKTYQESFLDVQDQAGRLRVWSSNVGALSKGPTSLDYRLREASTIAENVSKLLQEMAANLREMLSILQGERLPFESQDPQDQPASSPSVSSDDSSDSGLFSDVSDAEEEEQLEELPARVQDLSNIINHLYKLATMIKAPGSRARPVKAAMHTQKDAATNVELFSVYANQDLRYVDEAIVSARHEAKSLESTSDDLVRRLASAVTMRRRQLAYWKRHYQKSTLPIPETPSIKKPESMVDTDAFSQFGLEGAPKTGTVVRSERHSLQSKPVTLLSGTEATAFIAPQAPEADETKSVTSIATSITSGTEAKVPFPPVPEMKSPDGFICPLCFAFCPPSFKSERKWR